MKRIMALTRGDPVKAYELVQGQLSVLVLRTQVMLSLSGIVITVTGFSGRTIAQTSELARNLVASGILIVLGAAGVAIGGVLRLKWLTQQMTEDTEQTLVSMLDLRDQKARYLNVALLTFLVGFACYCVAIALMLLATQPL
ncbi:MAG: hypothetical protein ABL982_14535 [Vicinamibacterales bacterium]